VLKVFLIVVLAVFLWSVVGKIFDRIYIRNPRKKINATGVSSSGDHIHPVIGRDLAYSYPHLGCGGTMVPTEYGWTCSRCLHRMFDYSRRPATDRDKPLEGPWLPCDCPRCKLAKQKTGQDPAAQA